MTERCAQATGPVVRQGHTPVDLETRLKEERPDQTASSLIKALKGMLSEKAPNPVKINCKLPEPALARKA